MTSIIPVVNDECMTNVLVKNRKASFEYELLDKYEGGMMLLGHEVKSLRAGGGNLTGSFISFRGEELWVEKMHIAQYEKATLLSYEPERPRKLLLRKAEMLKIAGGLKASGVTLIPLSCVLKNNKIKLEFALARGKKKYDKRESIKRRDMDRQTRRMVNHR